MISTQKKRAQGTGASTSYAETGCQPSKLCSRHLYQPTTFKQVQGSNNQSTSSSTRYDKGGRKASHGKMESLDQLKSAYFAKMQSLNKKLDNERALQKLQREESRSRSKSPLQPGRNMPRQMP